MIIKYSHFIIIIFFVFLSSCSKDLNVSKIVVGSNYQSNGVIDERNLEFDFTKFKNKKNLQEFVNSVYFAGDTICFSLLLNKNISDNIKFKAYYLGGDIKVLNRYKKLFCERHIIPAEAVSMERVDYFKNRISGFSLVGSILENTYKKMLKNKIDESVFSKPHYVLYMFIINNKLYKAEIIKFNI